MKIIHGAYARIHEKINYEKVLRIVICTKVLTATSLFQNGKHAKGGDETNRTHAVNNSQ